MCFNNRFILPLQILHTSTKEYIMLRENVMALVPTTFAQLERLDPRRNGVFPPLNWEGSLPPSIVMKSRRDRGNSRLCCLCETGMSVRRRPPCPFSRCSTIVPQRGQLSERVFSRTMNSQTAREGFNHTGNTQRLQSSLRRTTEI